MQDDLLLFDGLGLPLAGVRAVQQTGSTNDDALLLATQGALDGWLVLAEEQTQGRGRSQRRWVTATGAALAFSLLLRPSAVEQAHIGRFTALGALSVQQVLSELGLSAQIKWPNDVLVNGKKVCGVLAETLWQGNQAEAVILGVGVNVRAGAVPPLEELQFPATSVEDVLGHSIGREVLLRSILEKLFAWRRQLGEAEFLAAWQSVLAFRGQQVQVGGVIGLLESLTPDGSLLLRLEDGSSAVVMVGDVHLRTFLDGR